MKKIVLKGPFLTLSGYGTHARQLARWVLSKPNLDVKFIVTPWGNTPWMLNSAECDGLVGEIMKRTTDNVANADVAISVQLPNEWEPSMAKFNVGVTAGVETDRCNPSWNANVNSMQRVIVPSKHTKNCFVNSQGSGEKLVTPIVIVPESFHDACSLSKESLPDVMTFSTSFNFLIFGQITGNNVHNDRKNIFNTLKWINDVFKDDPSVGVILKTNSGKNSNIDKQVTVNFLNSFLTEIRGGKPGVKVHLLHGEMSDREVVALYRHPQVGALVTLTRGEGFGLPILEAAASGVPVIATGWSGHLDYLPQGKFINVMYNLSEIHRSRVDGAIFTTGMRWAEASEEDFKKKIKKFRQSPSTPREWAKGLAVLLAQTHSFDAISKAYDEALGDVI